MRPAARICEESYGGSVRRMSRSTPMRASAARFSESARSQAEASPAKTLRLKREGIPPRCSALVASDAPQLGELRVASLCVEAVAVLAGNRGHAWAEAADHDGRGGIAGEVA